MPTFFSTSLSCRHCSPNYSVLVFKETWSKLKFLPRVHIPNIFSRVHFEREMATLRDDIYPAAITLDSGKLSTLTMSRSQRPSSSCFLSFSLCSLSPKRSNEPLSAPYISDCVCRRLNRHFVLSAPKEPLESFFFKLLES
jgi:hypothetical protein